jgi:hypothetical protein
MSIPSGIYRIRGRAKGYPAFITIAQTSSSQSNQSVKLAVYDESKKGSQMGGSFCQQPCSLPKLMCILSHITQWSISRVNEQPNIYQIGLHNNTGQCFLGWGANKANTPTVLLLYNSTPDTFWVIQYHEQGFMLAQALFQMCKPI